MIDESNSALERSEIKWDDIEITEFWNTFFCSVFGPVHFSFVFLRSFLLRITFALFYLLTPPWVELRSGVTKQALPPHSPLRYARTRLHFYREKTPAIIASLVDSHRIAPTHASVEVDSFYILFFRHQLKSPTLAEYSQSALEIYEVHSSLHMGSLHRRLIIVYLPAP